MYHKPQKVSIFELKRVLKRGIEPEIYRKFSHFVYLTKPMIEPIPGSYSIYFMHNGGIVIATNALCINEWLTLHNMKTKEPLSQFTCNHRMKANEGMDIDNRTPEWTKPLPPPKMPVFKMPVHSEVRETVWDLYTNQNCSTKQIAEVLGFTIPNIYYHINKKQKELDKQP